MRQEYLKDEGISHVATPRVSKGRSSNRIPTKTVYPFMVYQEWYTTHIVERQRELRTRSKDPRGFGTNLTGEDDGNPTSDSSSVGSVGGDSDSEAESE